MHGAPAIRYTAAVLAAVISLGAAVVFPSILAPVFFSVLVLGVAWATWLGGLGPGLVTLAVSTLGAIYFGHVPLDSPMGLASLGVYLLGSVVMTFLMAHLVATNRQLRIAQEDFQLLADHAPVLIWVSDASPGSAFLNKSWLEFVGAPAETPLETAWMTHIHPDDHERCATAYHEAAAAQHPFRLEYRLRRCDGQYRAMLMHGVPRLDPDNHFQGYIGSCMDITDYQRAEGRMRQASKMEAVGRLAGGIAHDFNNVLMVISTLTDLLLEGTPDEDVRHSDLLEIRQTATRAHQLIQQLLVFSRKEPLTAVPLNLNRTIEMVVRMIKPLIGPNVRLVADMSTDLGAVRADSSSVEQVFMNLLLNARDALPEGGEVTIETRNIIVAQQVDLVPGPYALVRISDTGIGMDFETQAQIFEPFYTTKDLGRGTGLGLSTVYSILRQLGGTIEVTSAPGQGSVFTVLFPQTHEEVALAPVRVRPVLMRGSETVLLVEDDHNVRGAVRRMITSAGYSVHEATNGVEALEVLARERIQIILSDMIMPTMNGRELYEAVKVRYPAIPVVFMSGWAEGKPGPDDRPILLKPFDPSSLMTLLRQALAGAVTK